MPEKLYTHLGLHKTSDNFRYQINGRVYLHLGLEVPLTHVFANPAPVFKCETMYCLNA